MVSVSGVSVLLVLCVSVQWTLADMSAGIDSLKTALKHVTDETEQLKTQLADEDYNIKQGQQRCEENINKMGESQKRLSEEFNANINQMQSLQSGIAELLSSLRISNDEKTSLEDSLKQLTYAHNVYSIDAKGFEEKRAKNLNTQCDDILEKINQKEDQQSIALRSSFATSNISIEDDEILVLSAKIRHAKHELDEVSRDLARLQKIAADNQAECEAHVQSLLTAIKDTEGDVEKAKETIEKFTQQKEQLSTQLETVKSDIENIRAAKDKTYMELEAMRSKYQGDAECYEKSLERIENLNDNEYDVDDTDVDGILPVVDGDFSDDGSDGDIGVALRAAALDASI